jgi:hypothetical protein
MAADAIIGPTIEQLRANCPPFAGNVAGAADFRQGLVNYNANMKLPAGYVVPLDQTVEDDGYQAGNQVMTGLIQTIRKTIGIIVEFDATGDRRGQEPVMDYDTMEDALFSALLNWVPVLCRSPNGQGFAFEGGRFLDLDRARLFYQWEFTFRYQIDFTDGWPGDQGVPLTGIEVDIYTAPPFAPLPPADGSPPAAVIVIPTSDEPVSPAPLEEEVAT